MDANQPPRRLLRSAGALLAGLVAVVLLSVGSDELMRLLGLFPPAEQGMSDPALNLLALAYRCVYGAVGSWIAAALAPRRPMLHALILGGIGFILSIAGAIAMMPRHLGPDWYPIALILTALPCAWLGGLLQQRRQGS